MNFRQNITLYGIICLLLVAIFHPVKANDTGFSIAENQSIKADGLQFPNMEAYLASDYFRNSGKRCGTKRKNAALKPTEPPKAAKSINDCTNTLTRISDEYNPTVEMTIQVWFHVITNTSGQGNVSDSAIQQQMIALNEDFQAIAGSMGAGGIDTKIKFVLAGTTRTTNNDWYTDSNEDETAYKTALAKDPKKYLNVYTNDAQGNLGYAYYPQDMAGQTKDGVVMLSGSIGGRNNGFGSYNQGRTLVHEIGHYLGLAHTFEGGTACQNTFSTGDLIVDTNAESEAFYGNGSCSATRTTCGSPDPVDNYMNYNVDSCMNRFTSQQVNRMICSIVNYRQDLTSISATNNAGKIIPILDLLLGN